MQQMGIFHVKNLLYDTSDILKNKTKENANMWGI